jgi:hypothetical protein
LQFDKTKGDRHCSPHNRKMPTLVKAAALAAATILISDGPSTAACHHFSVWHFPWPQRCTTESKGNFIHEPNPPTSVPAPPPKPTPDEEWQRQQAIEKTQGTIESSKAAIAFDALPEQERR